MYGVSAKIMLCSFAECNLSEPRRLADSDLQGLNGAYRHGRSDRDGRSVVVVVGVDQPTYLVALRLIGRRAQALELAGPLYRSRRVG